MPPAKTLSRGTADPDGLLGARLLDGSGGATVVGWDAIRGWTPTDGSLWIHLDRTAPHVREWLPAAGVPELIVHALLAEDTRPRFLAHGNGLLVILRAVNLNPGADPDDMISLRLWLEPGRVISLRAPRLAAVDEVIAALEQGVGPREPTGLLLQLAEGMTDRLGPVVDNLEALVEGILDEADVGAMGPGRHRDLVAVRRQAVGLRRFIAPQRDLLADLPRARPELLGGHADRMRELSERAARFVDDLDAVLSHAAIANDAIESVLNDRLNRKMYLLSVITGVFLPLSLITGLLGINVWVPGQSRGEDLTPFAIVCGLLALVAIVQVLIFRRRRWL